MSAPAPRCDLGAEQAIVGLILLVPGDGRIADAVLDVVQPGDFYSERLREVMVAIVELRGDGHVPDWRAVVSQLRSRGKLSDSLTEAWVEALPAAAVAVGGLRRLCESVAALAVDRRRIDATYALQAAVYDDDDEGAWDRAVADLHEADRPRGRRAWASPDEIADRLYASIEGSDPVRWPWPLQRLNRLSGGGARRGQLTFIGGASSHGKSVLVDLALQSMAKVGARTALFLNEMTVEERAERVAANLANVRYGRIQAATSGEEQLNAKEAKAIINAMAGQQVAFCPCAGWSAEQIVREARRRQLDVIAVDLVQKLPFQAGRPRHQTLEDAVQRFDAFAKDTGCHVIMAGQINRERANGTFPVPGLADIKDCAELGNGADNVLFVWREQDPETLDPLDQGVVRMAKYRGARLETIPATFEGDYQRWTERALVA